MSYPVETLLGKYVEGQSGCTKRGYCEHQRRKLKALLAEAAELVEFLARTEDVEGLAQLEERLSDEELLVVGNGSIENYFCNHKGCDSIVTWRHITLNDTPGYGEAVCPVHGVVDLP